jgi:hypothetical protein
MNWAKGLLEPDAELRESVKTLGQLVDLFADRNALRAMDANTVIYRVQAWCPVPEGTEGGLFWGVTVIEAGLVGQEYFMTHGHFHLKRDRSEYYATLEVDGALNLDGADVCRQRAFHSPANRSQSGKHRQKPAAIHGLLAERCRARLRNRSQPGLWQPPPVRQ